VQPRASRISLVAMSCHWNSPFALEQSAEDHHSGMGRNMICMAFFARRLPSAVALNVQQTNLMRAASDGTPLYHGPVDLVALSSTYTAIST
jgi:hypothetical protein